MPHVSEVTQGAASFFMDDQPTEVPGTSAQHESAAAEVAESHEGEQSDQPVEVVHCLTVVEVNMVLKELADWSISWDARSRASQCFTSITLSPKM